MGNIVRRLFSFLRRLDAESVTTFQSMYYVVFTVSAVFLVFFPDFHAQYVDKSLGRFYYDSWLALTLICPSLTLAGRRLMTLSTRVPPNGANSAYGAAWLQLCGDGGVWGTILVYVASMLTTDWWSKELYTFAFLLMGVAGGAMFTMRSVRRIIQIEKRKNSVVGE